MLVLKEDFEFSEQNKYDDLIGWDIGFNMKEDFFEITYNPRNINNKSLSGDVKQSVSLNENEKKELRDFIIKIIKQHNFLEDLEQSLITEQLKIKEN